MVIIYGRRSYGRVEARGGEHAQTSFAHVWYMPLVPTGSHWVIGDRGYEIQLSGKSVVAAYLRMWGPIAAIGCFVAGSVGSIIAGCLIAALSLLSWTWRNARAGDARRSDFNLLAFGSRCEPARMTSTMRASLRHDLEQKHAKLDEVRPPEDIARYGARSLEEAVLAYGLLRLASLEHRDGGAASVACLRLLHGDYEVAAAGDGPYRQDHATPSAIVAEVEKLAAATTHATSTPGPAWHAFTWKRGALAVVLALIFTGGALGNVAAFASPTVASAAQLDSGAVSRGFVEVHCDGLQTLGSFSNGDFAYGCALGDRFLPVRSADPVVDATVVGKVHAMNTAWPSQIRLDHASYDVFLSVHARSGDRAVTLILFALDLALLALIGSWIVRRVRNN